MYLADIELFTQTARFWTETYATVRDEGEGGQDALVSKLVDMGFDAAAARQALESHNWDESAAVNSLLGM